MLHRHPKFGSSKGISTAIATVFLVLTVIVLSTNVFIWTLSQNALYNQAARTRNLQDSDRLSERILASNTTYSIPTTGTVDVYTIIMNQGSMSSQIVTLLVVDSTRASYNATDLRAYNINLNPGDNRTLSYTVGITEARINDSFSGWLVTARGNTFHLDSPSESNDVIWSDVTQGIGSMSLDFSSFGYYEYYSNSTTRLANYPTGIINYNIQTNTPVAFRATLKNLDPRKIPVTLDSHTLFWQPGIGGANERAWFIVNVAANGTIHNNYTPITLAYKESKTIVFAAIKDLSTSGFSYLKTPPQSAVVSVFLLLHGTIGSYSYGQNIPFVSIFYY